MQQNCLMVNPLKEQFFMLGRAELIISCRFSMMEIHEWLKLKRKLMCTSSIFMLQHNGKIASLTFHPRLIEKALVKGHIQILIRKYH